MTDNQRLAVMMLVKDGSITVDEAMAEVMQAEGLESAAQREPVTRLFSRVDSPPVKQGTETLTLGWFLIHLYLHKLRTTQIYYGWHRQLWLTQALTSTERDKTITYVLLLLMTHEVLLKLELIP